MARNSSVSVSSFIPYQNCACIEHSECPVGMAVAITQHLQHLPSSMVRFSGWRACSVAPSSSQESMLSGAVLNQG